MKPLKIAHPLASVQHFCSFQSLPNGSFAFFSPVRCKVVAKKGRQSFLIAWSLQNKCTIYLGTHGTNNLDELFYLYWISQILPIFIFLLLLSGLIFHFFLFQHIPNIIIGIQSFGDRIIVSDVQESVHFVKYRR